jgi:PilZ domain
MDERRAEPRRRTLFAGRVGVDNLSTFDCVVRNMSSSGARLECRLAASVDAVSLEMTAAPGFRRNGRIVWRRLEDLGVQFF